MFSRPLPALCAGLLLLAALPRPSWGQEQPGAPPVTEASAEASAPTATVPAAAVPPLVQAVVLYEQGRFAAAAEVFRAQAVQSSDPLAYLWWGMSLYREGVLQPATEAWATAETSPAWAPTVHLLMALTHWQSGRSGEARDWLTRCQASPAGAALCASAATSLAAGAAAPPVAQWTNFSGIRQALEQRYARVSENTAADPMRRRTLMATATPPGGVAEPGTASLGAGAVGGAALPAAPAPGGALDVTTPGLAGPPATTLSAASGPQLRAGQRVLVRTAGRTWQPGEVIAVGEGAGRAGFYQVRDVWGGERWYYQSAVAPAVRDASWTSWFVGVWDVRMPALAAAPGIPSSLAQGVNLPPLRVDADGTFLWAEGERTIQGRWVPREDAPGIILRRGLYGEDWHLYNATDPASFQQYGGEVLMLQAGARPFFVGLRLPN